MNSVAKYTSEAALCEAIPVYVPFAQICIVLVSLGFFVWKFCKTSEQDPTLKDRLKALEKMVDAHEKRADIQDQIIDQLEKGAKGMAQNATELKKFSYMTGYYVARTIMALNLETVMAKDILNVTSQECHAGSLHDLGNVFRAEGDLCEALSCWKKAADLGFAPSIFNLGMCHEIGLGGARKSTRVASTYYEEAARKGLKEAIAKLGGHVQATATFL